MKRDTKLIASGVIAGLVGVGLGSAIGHEITHDQPAAATTGIQTVTVAPSPACSDMARTWQQIALRYSRVATLAATGHHHQAGVEAQRTIRFVHSARVHHLIRNGACK